MTTPRSLASRISALESTTTDDGRFALEVSEGDDVELALRQWRKSHGGREPLMVLILPGSKPYEPQYP